ncbi:G2/mitotic-specific cyclin-B3 [Pyxicephalus adspersus]|uniref:G2/mitotic-specific cyclin-B3 n=1 Tax=Pyxicephalus adspersus TaxID=30357 RepID=A0AAV3A3N3_PYXAD|nr:TPA: hypothetical protein GDO54_018296 [Pyxicephalus adspersus]
MMPNVRQSRLPRPGMSVFKENPGKEHCTQTKRSPSSPQGGAKKRSALGELTNAHKKQQEQQKKKDGQKVLKKTKATSTLKNNEANIKRAQKKVVTIEASLNEEKETTVSCEEAKPQKKEDPEEKKPIVQDPAAQTLPAEVEDIDNDSMDDPFANAEYALDIFTYMRSREEKFILPDYMELQVDISKEMRSILVDWMVDVQENFELNHETLYLAVKLVDHYLAVSVTMREKLQLIGSTAVLIASKFEERCPPCLDNFLYICDDAYRREEVIAMEMDILQKLNFDINIPVPYRFLRRFAKCAHATMETLTLARYICELTLQEYEFVQERASKMAASCLYLALKMKDLGGWTPTLQYYSGFQAKDLLPLVRRLNTLLRKQPNEKLKTVWSKYTHRVFFEVAKLPPLDMKRLDDESNS